MLEVVPSTTRPTTHVHLKCGYNSKYLGLGDHPTIPRGKFLLATADAPSESINSDSTLFVPHRWPGNIVTFEHITELWLKANPITPSYIIAEEGRNGVSFEYSRWESFVEWLKAKDEEIKRLNELLAEFHTSDGESLTPAEVIRELREHIAEQNRLIEELYEQIGGRPAPAAAAAAVN
ncbi:hypothetical protein LINGRAHAP2_LOCUS33424 [Linum grandiflorum]